MCIAFVTRRQLQLELDLVMFWNFVLVKLATVTAKRPVRRQLIILVAASRRCLLHIDR